MNFQAFSVFLTFLNLVKGLDHIVQNYAIFLKLY